MGEVVFYGYKIVVVVLSFIFLCDSVLSKRKWDVSIIDFFLNFLVVFRDIFFIFYW